MNDMRKKMCAALLCLLSVGAMGQTVSSTSSGTNSPYSQYALGELVDPSGGVGKGMNGLGIAYRDHAQVNHLNPASYSAIDSLSFIFDLGLSGQILLPIPPSTLCRSSSTWASRVRFRTSRKATSV